ncbi:hypothetical protein OH77DRAFT_1472733 [Trametes cingulata]|nr:hypothetical protein OH77DRAFT_1472733 [Trametes cingulata]
MHRALSNPDVLSHLFLKMVQDLEENDDIGFAQRLQLEAELRATLLRCALVCRAFCDPALTALWWRLDNLVPLLRLLSCFVPTKVKRNTSGEGPRDETLYLLKGELCPKEWERFCHYARRVRVFNHPKNASVTPHIVSQLSKWNNGAPLLPGMKDLTWLPASPTDTSALLLGTESLESLHIVLDCIELPDEYQWISRHEKMELLRDPLSRNTGDKQIEKMLVTYSECTPRLKTLELPISVHPLCLAPVARFTHLTALHLPETPFDARLIRDIASNLKILETLMIDVLLTPYEPDASIVGFRHLSTLDVTGSATDLTRLFKMINPLRELRALVLTFPNGIPELTQTYRRPLEVLKECGHAPALASCKLSISTRWNTSDTVAQLLEPLLSFPTLEHVSLQAGLCGYQVTEGDLERMARAWPKLESLALKWNAKAGGTTPPLRALAHFAQHCPDLRTLILSHIDTYAPLPPEPYKVRPHGLLHIFTLHSYRVKDPKAIGKYVSALFPNILVAVPDPRPSGWDQVLHMANAWRVARAEKAKQLQAERAAQGS